MSRLSNSPLYAVATAAAFALASSHSASAFVAPGGAYRANGTSSLLTPQRRSTLSLHMAKADSSFQQKDSMSTSSTALQASSVADVETVTAADDTVATKKTSWNDDGFVFGLEGSGLERPKGRTASVVVEGDSLENQPHQIAGNISVPRYFLCRGCR
jgi:hypothetical protein